MHIGWIIGIVCTLSTLSCAQSPAPSTTSVGGETTSGSPSVEFHSRLADTTTLTSMDLEAAVFEGVKTFENNELNPPSAVHYRALPTPTAHPYLTRPVPVIPGTVLPAMRNVLPQKPDSLAVEATPATAVIPASTEADLENKVSVNSSLSAKNRLRVYATLDGRFHKRECRFAREALPLSRGEAVAKDLKPCPVCRP